MANHAGSQSANVIARRMQLQAWFDTLHRRGAGGGGGCGRVGGDFESAASEWGKGWVREYPPELVRVRLRIHGVHCGRRHLLCLVSAR